MGPLFFASLQCDRFCISIVCANFVPVKRAASAVPIGSPHRALFITAGPAVSIGLPYPVDLVAHQEVYRAGVDPDVLKGRAEGAAEVVERRQRQRNRAFVDWVCGSWIITFFPN
jgi:hypothetical protein